MTKIVIEEKVAAAPEVMTLKNFRANADIENFYRFIHDNSLRLEANMLIDHVMKKMKKVKKSKKVKTLH
jgi:hypothetical protein